MPSSDLTMLSIVATSTCGAWLAVAACVAVGAAASKTDLLDTLALIRRECD